MEGGHQATLAGDVGGARDPGPGRGHPQHGSARVEADPVRETGVTLGDRLHRVNGFAEMALEVFSEAGRRLDHAPSRCATSTRLPTTCRSPSTRMTLTLVKYGKTLSDPNSLPSRSPM